MSLAARPRSYPLGPGRTHVGSPGSMSQISTDGVPVDQRLDFWREAHLNRMDLSRPEGSVQPFNGRIRRYLGVDTHMMEHSSDPLNAWRGQEHFQRDGADYCSLNLVLDCSHTLVEHAGVHRMQPGAMLFIDSARPVRYRMGRNHIVSLFLPRRKVHEAIGADPGAFMPELLPHTGIGAVLRSQLRVAVQQAAVMTPDQRVLVISSCASMGLAMLQASHRGHAGPEQFTGSMHEVARALIENRCADPQLDPAAVAAALGYSRASLYRLFAQQGQSVAAAIRSARLERASRMLQSGIYAGVPLAEIGFRCGFTDQAGFNRAFKRRYGASPGEVRLKMAS